MVSNVASLLATTHDGKGQVQIEAIIEDHTQGGKAI